MQISLPITAIPPDTPAAGRHGRICTENAINADTKYFHDGQAKGGGA